MSEMKLTADSGGGTVALKAPASTTSNASVQFKLPVADGSAGQVLQTDGSGNLSWLTLPTYTNGITGFDTWSLTADKNWSGYNIFDSGFTRNTNFPAIGSAMTMSSGVFTFPTTGIWEVFLQANIYDGTPNAYSEVYIRKSTDSGSNFTTVSLGDDSIWDDDQNVYANPSCSATIDVTNTSTIKVQLSIDNEQGAHVAANASILRTYATFKRLGDT